MDSQRERQLESTLTARYARPVRVTQLPDHQICVVFEPSGDRGRVGLLVTGAGAGWTVSDRGATSAMYGLDLDMVIAKLAPFDATLVRQDNEIISNSNGRSLAECVAEFIDSIEFVPVLVGLFAMELAA